MQTFTVDRIIIFPLQNADPHFAKSSWCTVCQFIFCSDFLLFYPPVDHRMSHHILDVYMQLHVKGYLLEQGLDQLG